MPVITVVLTLLGGTGLFLLGMSLLTEGLNALGGSGIRALLRRLTGTPAESFLAGTTMTLLTQTSSATVLSTIGFLGAGMIPLTACPGLVVGATVGTTSTSWLVSVVGLSSGSSSFFFPALAVGAFLRMFGRERTRQVGTALAGLAVLLASINFISHGLSGAAGHLDLGGLTTDSLAGRVGLLGTGILMAVAMQSSAAPIAIVMVGLDSGAVTLEQACLVLLGATVGTTSTGFIVSVVGGVPARRVALLWSGTSVVQAIVALALFTPLVRAAAMAGAFITGRDTPDAVYLAAFHTLSMLTGGIPLVLSTRSMTRLVTRLLPTDPDAAEEFALDPNVLGVPGAAIAAVHEGVVGAARQVAATAQVYLRAGHRHTLTARLRACATQVEDLREAMRHITVNEGDRKAVHEYLDCTLALDHLARMVGDMRILLAAPLSLVDCPTLSSYRTSALHAMDLLAACPAKMDARALQEISQAVSDMRARERAAMMDRMRAMQIAPDRAVTELELMRQIDRMVHHAAKVVQHLSGQSEEDPPPGEASGGPTGHATAAASEA